MANRLIKNILKTIFTSEGVPASTNWVVVLVSFMLAVTLWFLVTLNREYVSTFSLPAKIEEVPDNVQLTETVVPQLEITSKGVGFDLLTEHLRLRKDTLPLDFSNRKGEYLLSRDYRITLGQHFSKRLTLQGVRPDTIFLSFDYRTQKQVPLKPDLKVRLSPSFQVDSLVLERPDSVFLVGPESMLDSIQVWYTAPVEVVVEDFPRRYRVPVDTLQGIKVSPKEAVVFIQPRQYAQKQLELFLEAKGTPENLQVNFNPPLIQLSCLVPLEDFGRVVGPFYLPVYYDSLDQEVPYFLPQVEQALPKGVKVLWRSPMEVSYVIVEKLP